MVERIATEPTPEDIDTHKLYARMGMTDAEYALVVQQLGRKPTYTEIGVYSVMWSEHCSYKHSKTLLRLFPTTGSRVLMGPGEGAGIVDIGGGRAVVFKIESHNHPSAIEPFQGAATGVGGIIRDIFSMGARPIALLNALRFGNPNDARVRYTFEHVVAGIAGYGNACGIPTVGGEVAFDEAYTGNPLVNAMCVGLIEHKHIQRGIARGVGNPVYYVGPPTGRDGIQGATFASEQLSEQSASMRPAVQVGDPFMEKLVMEACLDVIARGLVLGIQDMGAAGLTCSSAEMASKAGNGMELWLDRVPMREPHMTPYELMLSESQERMLFVTTPDRDEAVRDVFAHYGLDCVHVGVVTDTGYLTLKMDGHIVGHMPVRGLVDDCPIVEPPAEVPAYITREPTVYPPVTDYACVLHALLAHPTIASKEWVYAQYDYMVRTSTIVPPGSDAAVVRIPDTHTALAMCTDGNGRYVYLDPCIGGRIAVAEAARNVVCSGGQPLALTDNLNFGSPQKPDRYWQLQQAVIGMAQACTVLNTPVIGGNVSLYNEHEGKAILPTPVVGMVGLVHDLEHVTTIGWKNEQDVVFLLGDTYVEWGGSAFQAVVYETLEGTPPMLDLEVEKRLQDHVLACIQAGWIASAHDVSEGGLAVALAECAIAGNIGAKLTMPACALRPDEWLFSETQSRIVVSTTPVHAQVLMRHMQEAGVPIVCLGTVGGNDLVVGAGEECLIAEPVDALRTTWKGAIPCMMQR